MTQTVTSQIKFPGRQNPQYVYRGNHDCLVQSIFLSTSENPQLTSAY